MKVDECGCVVEVVGRKMNGVRRKEESKEQVWV
jgi:hypothetical protein